MNSHLKNLISGLIVGIANIIPGVSGGTMAVILGVYQPMIEIMGLKNVRKNIPFIVPFGIGMLAGIIAFSNIIQFLLANFEMATKFSFIGLILGSVPLIWKNASSYGSKLKNSSLAAFVAAFLFMLAMNLANAGNPDIITELSPAIAVRFIVVAAISSFAMILPGLSGSFVMLLLGIYPSFLAAISRFDIIMLIPIGCGLVIGLVLGSRLVAFLLEKLPQATYFAILGLILGSLFALYPGFIFNLEGIISIILMFVFAFVAYSFSKKEG